MKISFHGAARTVTGSKHLVQLDNNETFLLDCGLFQGMGRDTDSLNAKFGFDATKVDYVILSHAHIDHSGLLPKLVKEGFTGTIYCTPGTKALTEILLEDSAMIQRDDAKYGNKRRAKQGLPPIEPLYDMDDVNLTIPLFKAVEYNTPTKISDSVEVLFTDAGHIIGSAAVSLKIKNGENLESLTFSGDIGRYRDMILRSPSEFPHADYIIIESTYGDKLHDLIHTTPDDLLKWIESTCVEQKGNLIIPAFSVGRTQEILFELNQLSLEKRLPHIPIYVDSPLSMEATEVLKKFPKYFNKKIQKILEVDDDPFDFEGLRYIKSVEESKALNEDLHPKVIISASGMADAGRVKHHIKNNISNAKNTILLVGYCEPHSLGGRLMNGAKEVKIYSELYDVVAKVGSIRSMSAHGDYEDLMQFLACQTPDLVKQVFVVHGEAEVQDHFAERLRKKGFKEVHAPEMHESFELQ
ncbi:MAG: MBL fold metallo-hydrolase [Chitinophagia bacterium]|jgi:metallo-beta-lactamase family protein|nr:MBL fold metallo-hydrolase [Chitinophagia bacterium]